MRDQKPTVDWASLAAKPEFAELLARKSRFIISSSVFFVAYYFALPVLVGWFPDLMKREVLGKLNLAYVFALSQFVMAWVLAFLYTRKAAEWDKAAANVVRGQQ